MFYPNFKRSVFCRATWACNQLAFKDRIMLCWFVEYHSRRVSPESFFFFLQHPFYQVSHYHCYSQQKKRCDEKDRLIISKWIFSMLQALLSEKVDGKQFRIELRLIYSWKKSIRTPRSIILGEISQIQYYDFSGRIQNTSLAPSRASLYVYCA